MQMHQAKPCKNGGCRLVDGGRGGGGLLTIAPQNSKPNEKKNTEKAYKNESPGFCMSYVYFFVRCCLKLESIVRIKLIV
jgi:hypothetical protein